MKRTVFYVSDGTAITSETFGHTLLTQFDGVVFEQETIPFVTDKEAAERVVEAVRQAAERDGQRPIVFSTLLDPEIQAMVATSDALILDMFSVFIQPLEIELETKSNHTMGKSHGLTDRGAHKVRIDAVNFALRHDDGASTEHYDDADVILVGVSRCGKTPTCLYLALQFGIRAANYPLTPDDLEVMRLPAPLRHYQDRLFALSIDPERLQQLRSERRPDSPYSSLNTCRNEVRDAEALYRIEKLDFLDTTGVSIEEIASRLMQAVGLDRRMF